MACNTPHVPCCAALINGPPAVLLPPTELTVPLTTPDALIPRSATCVTLTFRLCANPAAAANQVQLEIVWSTEVGVNTLLTQEVVLQQTATCGLFDTCFQEINSPTVSPPDCILWDLSFTIPAGKTDIQVNAEEIGDPANPGTLEVWVAFK